MNKRVHEETLATVLLALAGVAALVVSVPEWAQMEVLVFVAVFAAIAVAVDDDIRDALRFRVPKSKPAKAPAANRAAT